MSLAIYSIYRIRYTINIRLEIHDNVDHLETILSAFDSVFDQPFEISSSVFIGALFCGQATVPKLCTKPES